jgi:DNA-binding MurR/RpiR family transcriptional regulator
LNQIVADVVSCQNQIDSFFVNQRIALLLKKSNIAKKFGVSPVAVMRFIFSLVFTGKNLFRYLNSAESGDALGKDTVYRFLNSTTATGGSFCTF